MRRHARLCREGCLVCRRLTPTVSGSSLRQFTSNERVLPFPSPRSGAIRRLQSPRATRDRVAAGLRSHTSRVALPKGVRRRGSSPCDGEVLRFRVYPLRSHHCVATTSLPTSRMASALKGCLVLSPPCILYCQSFLCCRGADSHGSSVGPVNHVLRAIRGHIPPESVAIARPPTCAPTSRVTLAQRTPQPG